LASPSNGEYGHTPPDSAIRRDDATKRGYEDVGNAAIARAASS